MANKVIYILLFCLLHSAIGISQTQPEKATQLSSDLVMVQDTIVTRAPINVLAPSRAAFYSAVLPGLGQAYNKKYWKIPIFVGGITTGILIYNYNNKDYKRYRNAYKSRLAGNQTDEFWGMDSDGNPNANPRVTTDGLVSAQKTLKRNKELSLLITIGIYALNILDANVDAHLLQFNVDQNLALKPHYKYNELESTSDLGLTLNFNF